MKHRKPLPPAKYLHSIFSYNPETGDLCWTTSRRGLAKVGLPIRSRFTSGYLRVTVDQSSYRVHLIIWKMMTGKDPVNQVDHWDLNRGNNKWGNLRPATGSQNLANMGITVRNTSGFKGVSIYRPTNKWRASIRKDGRLYFLGDFERKEDAHAAYVAKAIELFGKYARAK